MEQQKRIDKILKAIETRVQDEVGALLGAEFYLDSGARKIVGKEAVVEGLQGKQICVHLELTGDVSGKAYLLMGIKDAIRLGGTLIMLPDSELQEVIGREEYREEVEDSFGEIANIIAGSITKDFEEMYPKSCRFIRKEQEIVVPAKVDIESDRPISNQQFYLASFPMIIDGKQLGELVLLLPAASFDLEQENAEKPLAAEPVGQEQGPQKKPAQTIAKEPPKTTEAQPAEPEEPEEKVEPVTPTVAKSEPRKMDFDKQRKRIDRLLEECQKRLTIEIGALLGVDIFLDDLDNRIISKEEFFSQHAAGKQVIAEMEVVGDSQDTSYFAVGLKDAIHLGGILIMLPPAELTNVVNEEDFTDDTTDAYGEVANIVSGVYTAVFEEQYSKKLRFIRKQLKLVVPLKVETASDEPMPDKPYYSSRMSLTVEGKSLGNIHMLFPTDLLQLEMPKAEEIAPQVDAAIGKSEADAVKKPTTEVDNGQAASPEKAAKKPVRAPVEVKNDALDKHRKRVDKLLVLCREKVQSEVSALLGFNFQLSNQVNTIIGKEPFFSDFVSGKQIVVNMDVVGDLAGKSYLVVNLRDAIRIGGALIMLPNSELEAVVADEELGEDTQDAFGEIANIIAGVYTGVFEEQYTKKLRFIKTDLHQVVPMKVELEADEPFPNDEYYLSTMELSIDETILGKVNVLFPLELLQLEGLRTKQEPVEEEVADDAPHSAGEPPETQPASPDILLVGDDEAEAGKIGQVLGEMGYSVKLLTFKDNIHNYIPGQLKAIYLIMKEVNEQAFGAAIKVSSACSLPLIAAGPGWTRTKVIKAVKYGVRDILLTPAARKDIEENVTNNLMRLAA
ncbi:MAG: hypothetical protein A2X81_11640 [Desulfobacterales bacterium GWB2_56_26]|nr:MAG: hypothetical protein A2X81_11640 [Desulfobacterales bacterium GWB2_56_26]